MKLITTLKIDRDADDIYYDAQKKQIYISCGGGYLKVIRQETPDSYKLQTRIKTAEGGPHISLRSTTGISLSRCTKIRK